MKGNLFVVAAPSGAGKTSLVNKLIETLDNISVSISHTTRGKRPNETEGVNYFFIDKNKFEQMIAAGEFLEHANVFENYYGTSKRWVEETRAKGIDVILEIDWQGHQQIKKLFPDAISIFILPPSMTALRERLVLRDQDKAEVIEKRLADVRETMSHAGEFDYLVMNDDFERAVGDLVLIVRASRLLAAAQKEKFSELLVGLKR